MSSILFFPVFFVSSFFFFSCAHLKSLKSSNYPIEVQAKKQGREKSFDSLETGLNLFQEGKLNESRNQLEELNYKDGNFLSSIFEIQKINYIEQDWDRFFGLAYYYRKKFLYSYTVSEKNFKQEVLALEILALIRRCRFSEASRVIKWSLALAKKIKKDSSKIQKTIYFFKLGKHLGEKEAWEIDLEKQMDLWSVTPRNIRWLSNPKHVRVKVSNQC